MKTAMMMMVILVCFGGLLAGDEVQTVTGAVAVEADDAGKVTKVTVDDVQVVLDENGNKVAALKGKNVQVKGKVEVKEEGDVKVKWITVAEMRDLVCETYVAEEICRQQGTISTLLELGMNEEMAREIGVISVRFMVENYSTDELTFLLDFSKSPVGRKQVMNVIPQMRDLQLRLERAARKKLPPVKEEVAAEEKEEEVEEKGVEIF